MEKIYFCSKRECCPFLEYTQEGVYITDDKSQKIFLTKDNLKDLMTYLQYNKKEILEETVFTEGKSGGMKTLSDLDGSNGFLDLVYNIQRKNYHSNYQFLTLTGSYFDKIRLLNILQLTDFKIETEFLILFQTLYTIPTLGSFRESFKLFKEDKTNIKTWIDYLSKKEGIIFPNTWSSFMSSQIHNLGYRLSIPQDILDNVNALYYHPEINNKDSIKEPSYISLFSTLKKPQIKFFLNHLRTIRSKSSSYSLGLVDCSLIYKNVSETISNIIEILEEQKLIKPNEEI